MEGGAALCMRLRVTDGNEGLPEEGPDGPSGFLCALGMAPSGSGGRQEGLRMEGRMGLVASSAPWDGAVRIGRTGALGGSDWIGVLFIGI